MNFLFFSFLFLYNFQAYLVKIETNRVALETDKLKRKICEEI